MFFLWTFSRHTICLATNTNHSGYGMLAVFFRQPNSASSMFWARYIPDWLPKYVRSDLMLKQLDDDRLAIVSALIYSHKSLIIGVLVRWLLWLNCCPQAIRFSKSSKWIKMQPQISLTWATSGCPQNIETTSNNRLWYGIQVQCRCRLCLSRLHIS